MNPLDVEVILGAPSTAISGTAAAMNATASEPLVADLSRGVFSATDDADADDAGYFANACYLTNVRTQSGAESLFRGSSAEAPAAGFDGLRGMERVYGLGTHKLDAGEFVGINVATDTGLGLIGAFAVPAAPRNRRGRVALPKNVPGVIFAGNVDVAAGNTGTATLTAPEDMIIDLASLVTGADGAPGTNLRWLDQLQALEITAITLPTGENLIIGQNTPVAPAMAFHAERRFDFFKLGAIRIGSGASISVAFANQSALNTTAKVAFQAYTSAQAAKGGCSC
jgi:hypothetical protein